MPADGERLRTHAAHLLAFAVKARESGMITVANHLTARAAQCLAEAEAIQAAQQAVLGRLVTGNKN